MIPCLWDNFVFELSYMYHNYTLNFYFLYLAHIQFLHKYPQRFSFIYNFICFIYTSDFSFKVYSSQAAMSGNLSVVAFEGELNAIVKEVIWLYDNESAVKCIILWNWYIPLSLLYISFLSVQTNNHCKHFFFFFKHIYGDSWCNIF